MNYDEIIMSLSEIADQPTEDGMVDGVCQQTIRDALDFIQYQSEHIMAFLRDQEPKPVKFSENAYGYKTYYCPKCGRWFESQLKKAKYCDQCGQAVKWDE